MDLQIRIEALRKFSEQNALISLPQAILSNKEVKRELEELSLLLLKKTLGGCGNCYADALIELLLLNKKQAKEMAETEYQLKAGAILYDSEGFDSNKVLTNRNMTEELALFHLKQNPKKEVMFAILPEDWKDRIRKMAAEENQKENRKENLEEKTETQKPEKEAKKAKKQKNTPK